MPRINTAADGEEKGNNCALCTAAALTGQTSGDVNADLQTRCPTATWGHYESDRAFITYARNEQVAAGLRKVMEDQDYQDLADQIVGIAAYVKWKLNTAVRYHGFPDHKTTAATALPFMRSQPDGTRFAVFTSLQIFGMNAHWIYAEKQGERISFTDFQMDRQGSSGKPRTSVHPLGPRGREYTVRGKPDEADKTIYMFVVAFVDDYPLQNLAWSGDKRKRLQIHLNVLDDLAVALNKSGKRHTTMSESRRDRCAGRAAAHAGVSLRGRGGGAASLGRRQPAASGASRTICTRKPPGR